MDEFAHYEALAGSIKAQDITSDFFNTEIIRRIMIDNPEPDELYIHDDESVVDDSYLDFNPNDAREMGWLGYFVGKSTRLKTLGLSPVNNFTEMMEPFCRGLSRNKSIGSLNVNGRGQGLNLSETEAGDLCRMLGPFFRQSREFTHFSADECNFGVEGCRQLSLAIGSRTNSSLVRVALIDCGINGEQFADIAVALSMHPNLEILELGQNNIGRNGCKALATLLQFSLTNLRYLSIDSNRIDDNAVETLVQALIKCPKLKHLNIWNNHTISGKGWQEISVLLENPNCGISELLVCNADVQALVFGLARNQSLGTLNMGYASIPSTEQCWAAISALLCDTSSINKTFLSNHTLTTIFPTSMPGEVKTLLAMNKMEACKEEIAMFKILKHHESLDMRPLLEWELKVLPLAIDWFARAQSASTIDDATRRTIPARKFSAIYQFVRGMPMVYVGSRLRVQLREIRGNESVIDEEQLKLGQERLRLELKQQESDKRKRDVQEQKKAIVSRLSG